MSTFREDGAAALEWVARYLEGVGELPRAVACRARRRASCPACLATRRAGAVCRRPARSRPGPDARDHALAEPTVLRVLRDHGGGAGILAELLIAGLNQVGILWRASPALQELEEVTLDWLRQLLGLPDPMHGHIEDTASSGLITALAAARAAAPDRRVVVCSEHTHSSTAKAARLLELEVARVSRR